MEGKADLHMHTIHSDGACSTEELILRAQRAGLTSISITDHDTVNAVGEAMALGDECGVRVIPGVELSSSHNGFDIHLLGYFVDHTNAVLLDYLSFCKTARVRRAERIVEKLNGLRIPLRLETVLEQAGLGAVGRAHIAHALFEEGLTGSYDEAFDRYIGNGKPAYETTDSVNPGEAIELISAAGGLSFIAHPGTMIDEAMLRNLIRLGLDGIEVIHPSHSQRLTEHYRGIAVEYCLLESGGSDFHGSKKGGPEVLGKYTIPEAAIEGMCRRLA
jgi:predicted metal-dependent phosphoesterase TrpH